MALGPTTVGLGRIFIGISLVLAAFPSVAQSYLDTLGCLLEPEVRIEASSPVEGVLASRPVSRGDKVSAGDVLFTLRADVEKASVDLAKIRAQFARRHYERNEDLYRDDLISIHERDEFQTEYEIALQELEQSKAMLSLRTVRSPVDGIVLDHFIEQGEFVSNSPVLELAALDPLKVQIVMPFQSLGSIGVGETVFVHPAEPVGGKVEATVRTVDPVVDGASGTYRIFATLSNENGRIPAGVECQISQ